MEDEACARHVYGRRSREDQTLRGVTLDLYEGALIVLLGSSGSGKSPLLNILGALDVPTSGEVYYQDHILTKANDAELTRFRREHVGCVFQFYNLIPSLVKGLREGIEVILHPGSKLSDGTRVDQ